MTTNKAIQSLQDIQTLSTILSRANLAAQLGQQYGGDRNIYTALGYDTDIKYDKYVAAYERQDMAKAVIDRPVVTTWSGGFKIVESRQKDTDFENAWDVLYKRLMLRSKFPSLDRLTGLGTYGVLLLGLSDTKTVDDFSKAVQGVKHELLYVRPFSGMNTEGSAKIASWETDPSNERYGKPLTYSILVTDPNGGSGRDIIVHYSRVIHVVDGQLESEVEGTPRLQAIWNRLTDLEKIVGGSAEMFWRGARPGYHGMLGDEYNLTQEVKDILQDQIDEYEHNLRRLLITGGIDLKALAQQVSDPANHVDVCVQMISAATGIPKRILTGSERGELASTQDRENWADLIAERQSGFVEYGIIRPFVDRCIELRILPKPGLGYSVVWPDIRVTSEMDKATLGAKRAMAVRDYSQMVTAEHVLPPEAFLRFCLMLNDDEIEQIMQMLKEGSEELFPTEEIT